MRRRSVLTLPLLGLVATVPVAQAGGMTEFSEKAFNEVLASGKPVLLDFYTKW